MKENHYEEADRRITYTKTHSYRTIQFDNYDEMFENIEVGDNVLVFHNLGRYEMIVGSKDKDKIWVKDYVSGFYIYKNTEWCVNKIEKVLYMHMYEGDKLW